jgi:transaldolase
MVTTTEGSPSIAVLLADAFTVNTIPEATLKALGDHGDVPTLMRADGGNCEGVLKQFYEGGVDIHALAQRLQKDGADSLVKSWNELMGVIASKSAALK